MSTNPNEAVIAQRMKDFAERSDVRNLGVLLVGGLMHPFDYVDKITELALETGIDAPVRLN